MASHNRKKKRQLKNHRHWCTQCDKENYRFSTRPKDYSIPILRNCSFVEYRDLKPIVMFHAEFGTEDKSVWGRIKEVVNRLVDKFNFTLFNRK